MAFLPFSDRKSELGNDASERAYNCHFQRVSQRLLPIHRKLLIGFCRQFDQQAVEVVPEKSS
ncbi:MAG: hypothetical protein PVH61_44605, partial [Candidatus Aminicenantes bacterium]